MIVRTPARMLTAIMLVAIACNGCSFSRSGGSTWPSMLSRRSTATTSGAGGTGPGETASPTTPPSGSRSDTQPNTSLPQHRADAVQTAKPGDYLARESDYRESPDGYRQPAGNSPAAYDSDGEPRTSRTIGSSGTIDPKLFLSASEAGEDAKPLDGKVIEEAQIVAVVGNQSIQAGEINAVVNQMTAIMLNGKKVSDLPEEEQEQFKQMRERMFRSTLQADIQIKLIFLDFIRTMPDKTKVSDVVKSVNVKFEDELKEWREKIAKTPQDEIGKKLSENPILTRMALLMVQNQAESLGELERILKEHGSSLDRELRSYAEFKISHEMKRRNAKFNAEITHEQMLEYYREHHDTYAFKAKAKWEQLSVYFSRCRDNDEAMQRISEMGNAVYLGGATLAAVAKRDSHESYAEQGGLHDWTSQGSLASTKLDEAIFSLPLNRLSQIIEDERGVHIVRVLERTEGGHQTFESVQDAIREKIKSERLVREITQYVERLQKTTYVWTIFDGESGLSETVTP